MTVYVDDAYIPARVRSGRLTHDSRWCHLTADTTEELVAFAVSIGLQAKYLQYPGTWKEHFDVTEPKRKQAVAKGAVEVGYRDRIAEMGKRRMQELTDNQRNDDT
jgi:hypothetical protein